MNNREFEVKQELLTNISQDFVAGKQKRAFDRLCWFCNGLLSQIKELEDKVESLYQSTNGENKQ